MALLSSFNVGDLETMSRDVRALGTSATTMGDAAAEVSGYLHQGLLHEDGEPACVMVRIYATQPFKVLPERLAATARDLTGDLHEQTTCLVTLATNGSTALPPESLPEEHVLPLTPTIFEEIPLMPRLLERAGLDLDTALDPARAVSVRLQHRSFNGYLVHDLAEDPELLPNPVHRQVVRERGIKSVLCLVGVLPTGDLLMIFLQTRNHIPEALVRLLEPLGTAVKAALIPHSLRILPRQ